MSQIPEPWASALVRAGFTDPRYSDDRPSLGALAEAAGVHTTTVSRMVHGRGKPKHENVEAVAAALRVDVVEVSEWARQARTEAEPYRMPAEVNLLTRREQAAITELIRAMAEARREGEGSGDAAPKTPAGESPASKVHDLTPPDQDRDMDARVAELLAGPHAARRGTPEHAPDDTTGEESQDPGGDEPASNVHDLNRRDQGDPAPPADIAARDLGTPSRGQQLREEQDDAAHTPDPPAPKE